MEYTNPEVTVMMPALEAIQSTVHKNRVGPTDSLLIREAIVPDAAYKDEE